MLRREARVNWANRQKGRFPSNNRICDAGHSDNRPEFFAFAVS